jgi:ATP-dependent helicase/nuclease subunit A
MDTRSALIVDPDVFFGMKHYDLPFRTARPSVFRIAAEYHQSLADLEEFNRVLYVALTRAEQKMYIVDTAERIQPYRPDMNIYDLFRRKGITGLITAALPPIQDLFDIRTILPEEFPQIEKTEPEYAAALPHYSGTASVIPPILKPSQSELTSLPDLDLSGSERGTRYGTRIHAIIASLPDRLWTGDDLTAFDLSETDIRHLLAFSDSRLYHEALCGTIHKEMPFYTEDPESGRGISGVMDFVSFLPDRIVLIDFKTDNASAAEIRRRYSDQLNAYRAALNLMYPEKPVEVYAWSLHADTEIIIKAA